MDDKATSKIRIKLGPIEVEYDGSESFLKEELPALLAAVAQLYKESATPADALGGGTGSAGQAQSSTGARTAVAGTTGTIAANLGVKSGPELILAAAARLTFVTNTPSFTKKQITAEMKSATGFYKKSYLNNLSTYLQVLVRNQKLVEPTTETYALSVPANNELEKQLAQS